MNANHTAQIKLTTKYIELLLSIFFSNAVFFTIVLLFRISFNSIKIKKRAESLVDLLILKVFWQRAHYFHFFTNLVVFLIENLGIFLKKYLSKPYKIIIIGK